MPDVIDLSLDSEDEKEQDSKRQQEEASRKRIMDFATAVNASKRIRNDEAGSGKATASTLTLAASNDASNAPEGPQNMSALLKQMHEERMQRQRVRNSSQEQIQQAEAQPAGMASDLSIKLLSYNVWFKEEVALEARMAGLGHLITEEQYPHLICLQEVTHNMLRLWSKAPWWERYQCTPPSLDAPYFTMLLFRSDTVQPKGSGHFTYHFKNSQMGRGVQGAVLEVGGRTLVVATSHLESPTQGKMFSEQRRGQAQQALQYLDGKAASNAIWAGDMNWNQEQDGSMPLPDSWQDAWSVLHPGNPGLTYDCQANKMLTAKYPGKRLDRVLCKLDGIRLDSIRMVGSTPLPGQFHTEERRNGSKVQVPVLISDHFGLLATFVIPQRAGQKLGGT